jgi:hypothetical protein
VVGARRVKTRSLTLGDGAGIGAATACAIHCVATPWLVSAMPLLGLALGGSGMEVALLCASLAISGSALTTGRVERCDTCWRAVLAFLTGAGMLIVLRAGFDAEGLVETAIVTVGAGLIVYAHLANAQHCRQKGSTRNATAC